MVRNVARNGNAWNVVNVGEKVPLQIAHRVKMHRHAYSLFGDIVIACLLCLFW